MRLEQTNSGRVSRRLIFNKIALLLNCTPRPCCCEGGFLGRCPQPEFTVMLNSSFGRPVQSRYSTLVVPG